ncbi:energy transducer TonB [Bacteroidales bacterium OttesenSCG-928-I21]|nr:energy transducer TonB [Bacteroidales bacterium OttesenSCG-928-I21]
MKKNLIILLFISFSIKGFSTYQIKDYLIYDNDTLYFNNCNDLVSPLELIDSISFRIYEYMCEYEEEFILSSDCWRGFFAEWKIIDSIIYLSNVFECGKRKKINHIIEKILGLKFTNELLKADWVNGTFWCGKNENIENTSIYFSAYNYNCKLSFENGIIVDKEEYGQKENSNTPALFEEIGIDENKIYKLLVVETQPLFKGEPYEIGLMKYINKNITKYDGISGRVFVKFIIETDGTVSNAEIILGTNNILDAEALRIVNNLPQWTPGKIRDKAVRVEIILPISFNP